MKSKKTLLKVDMRMDAPYLGYWTVFFFHDTSGLRATFIME